MAGSARTGARDLPLPDSSPRVIHHQLQRERRRVECEWERAGPGHDEPGDGAGETRAGTVVRRQGWYSHRMTRASRRRLPLPRTRFNCGGGCDPPDRERRNQSSAVAQLSGNILRGVTVRDATYRKFIGIRGWRWRRLTRGDERVARRMVKAQKAEARPMGGAGELKGEPVGRADGGCESYPPPSPTRLTSVTFSAFKAAATVSLQDGVNYEEYTWAPPIRGIEMIIWAKEQSQSKSLAEESGVKILKRKVAELYAESDDESSSATAESSGAAKKGKTGDDPASDNSTD
ncbi:hypothetical protein B0H10DRAFT_1943672 [Mycena sp. CBHHK59/15]|nr:hypothetical protein B0H10DRAFT_1943672 [Mycena sp. CBHHK59/15]